MKNSHILLMVLASITFFACKNDNSNTKELIVGRWEVLEASRNGRPTESLADLYFDFSQDGKLMTNVAGIPEEGTYEVKGDKVLQRNTRLEADYIVEEITADNLVLTTELRGYAFRFAMKKDSAENAADTPQE